MASREIRPDQRLGRSNPKRIKMMFWAVGLLAIGGGLYAAYHYAAGGEVQIPVQTVRKGDFIIAVRTRGDIKSTNSAFVMAPQVPGLRIQKLARNGSLVKKGDIVVEFDDATQEQNVITRTNAVQQADGSITQMVASQRMDVESYALQKMQSEFTLEQRKLDASKAEVVSAIAGEESRIQVGLQEGNLAMVKARINANQVGNKADLVRLKQQRETAVANLEKAQSYRDQMKLRAPADGVVNVLSNFRSQGSYGRSGAPPFKEGDNAWTGAQILEIPELSSMYVDLKLDEVDRGKIALGQAVRLRVDSIPDKEFDAELDFISPAAAVVFTGAGANMSTNSEKNFPAKATLKKLDDRLRPGTSATVEIIIERQPSVLMIPLQANFDKDGKPAVWVKTAGGGFALRQIQVGKRNEQNVVVTGGLKEGDVVAIEDPVKLAKAAKKKL